MDCQESQELVSSLVLSSRLMTQTQTTEAPRIAMHGDKLHIAFCFKCYKSLAII